MSDDHLPSVSILFLKSLFKASDKVEEIIEIGDTTAYLLKGKSQLHKRIIHITNLKSGEVDFDCATSYVLRIRCMGELLSWLEKNKNWKDGAYIQSESVAEIEISAEEKEESD